MARKIEAEIEKIETNAEKDLASSGSKNLTKKERNLLMGQYIDIYVALKIFDKKIDNYFKSREEALKSNGRVKIPEYQLDHKFIFKKSDSMKNYFPNVYGKRLYFDSTQLPKEDLDLENGTVSSNGKDTISSEMAWAQLDGRFKLAFEEVSAYIIEGRQEDFFNKCKNDIYLARDLVGMTLVMKNLLENKQNRAFDMMIWFGLQDRLPMMKQYFKGAIPPSFEDLLDKTLRDAKNAGLTETELKEHASSNLSNPIQEIGKAEKYSFETVNGKTVVKEKNSLTKVLDIFNDDRRFIPPKSNREKIDETLKKFKDKSKFGEITLPDISEFISDLKSGYGQSKYGKSCAMKQLKTQIDLGIISSEDAQFALADQREKYGENKLSSSFKSVLGLAKKGKQPDQSSSLSMIETYTTNEENVRNSKKPEQFAKEQIETILVDITRCMGMVDKAQEIGISDIDFEIVELGLKRCRELLDQFGNKIENFTKLNNRIKKYEEAFFGVEKPENCSEAEEIKINAINGMSRKHLYEQKKSNILAINSDLDEIKNIQDGTQLDFAAEKVDNILKSISSLPKGKYIDYTIEEIELFENALGEVDRLIEIYGDDLKNHKKLCANNLDIRRNNAKDAILMRKSRIKINESLRSVMSMYDELSSRDAYSCEQALNGLINLPENFVFDPEEIVTYKDVLEICVIFIRNNQDNMPPEVLKKLNSLREKAAQNLEKLDKLAISSYTDMAKTHIERLKGEKYNKLVELIKKTNLSDEDIKSINGIKRDYYYYRKKGILEDSFVDEMDYLIGACENKIEFQKNKIPELIKLSEEMKTLDPNKITGQHKKIANIFMRTKKDYESLLYMVDPEIISKLETFSEKVIQSSQNIERMGASAKKSGVSESFEQGENSEEKGTIGVAEPVGKASQVLAEAEKGVEGTVQGKTTTVSEKSGQEQRIQK